MPDALIRSFRLAGLLLVLTLAGCGDLPQPFLHNPGATAIRLSQPPPARLAVPMPTASLLPDDSARIWASAMADALVAKELPAVANRVHKGDWHLIMTAETHGDVVIPTYTVTDPQGATKGNSQGPGVPAQDWAAGQPATFQAAAAAEAPKLITLLAGIEAQLQMSDPNSLMNRPPKIYFTGVTGAPGDGNTSLARQMTLDLPQMGDIVQDTAKDADFSLSGVVKTAADPNNQQRIEIQWIVNDAQGRERGRAVQLHDVTPGSLDSYWGDVAMTVGQEAAGGVHDIVVQATGRTNKPAGTPAKPADGAAKPSAGTNSKPSG